MAIRQQCNEQTGKLYFFLLQALQFLGLVEFKSWGIASIAYCRLVQQLLGPGYNTGTGDSLSSAEASSLNPNLTFYFTPAVEKRAYPLLAGEKRVDSASSSSQAKETVN